MSKDLLNEPYDEDVAAAVERLRQAWLEDKRRRAEIKRRESKIKAGESSPMLSGFEAAFEAAMNSSMTS